MPNDTNHDIVPTLRMFDGLMMTQAANEIERLREQVRRLTASNKPKQVMVVGMGWHEIVPENRQCLTDEFGLTIYLDGYVGEIEEQFKAEQSAAHPANTQAQPVTLDESDILGHMSKYWQHQWYDGDEYVCRISRAELAHGITDLLSASPAQEVRKQEYPHICLTRNTSGTCEVSIFLDGEYVPVIKDNGDIISSCVTPSGIEQAIKAHAVLSAGKVQQ